MTGLKSEVCLACEVCCRFHEAGSLMGPVFSSPEMTSAMAAGMAVTAFCQSGYERPEPALLTRGEGKWHCPAFEGPGNRCSIYPQRPMDCQLYPFVVTYAPTGRSVNLSADLACPYVVDNLYRADFRDEARELAVELDRRADDDGFVPTSFARPEFETLAALPALSRRLCGSDLGLARLTPQAAEELRGCFEAEPMPLAHSAVAPIFVWMDFFDIYYRRFGDRVAFFGSDGASAFLWGPPAGTGPLGPAAAAAIEVLRELGPAPDTWRIDNVSEANLPELRSLGLRGAKGDEEFMYERSDLVALAGRRYHGMRAAANFFAKSHQDIRFEPFRDEDIPEALALYRRWAAARLAKDPDRFYRAQIEAAPLMHFRTMRHAGQLGLVGRVLRTDGALVGYTFGFALPGTEIAVVLLEVADLTMKGAAAYLFREFARSWAPARWINTMGDSGLPNLRRAKMRYHPQQLLPVYTVRPEKPDGEAT